MFSNIIKSSQIYLRLFMAVSFIMVNGPGVWKCHYSGSRIYVIIKRKQ